MYGVGSVALGVGVGLGIAGGVLLAKNRGGVVSVDPLNGALRF
jgi:hypothetical protein